MKILVTGGCGFVGSNILIYLKKKKYNVSSLDNLFREGSIINLNRIKKFGIKNFKYNISDEKQIRKLSIFDLIIDCCAEASVEKSRTDSERVFNTNLKGTLNLVLKCVRDKTKIIFLSSSRIYSLKSLNKIIRNHKIKKDINVNYSIPFNFSSHPPRTLYGFTKFASEELIKEYSYIDGLKYIINRCGVISGPWQFGKQDQGFVSLWVWRHLTNQTIKFIGYGGYGNQVRDILHIDDLCELILLQIKNFNKVYNKSFIVGGGLKNSTSLKDLTKVCENISKKKCKKIKIFKTSKYDVPYFVCSNSLVKKIYSWKPKKSLNSIVFDIYNWQRENLKYIKKYM